MEQARYWMWASRKPVNLAAAAANPYGESWEEQAFAEDAAGALGGCVWPPRSYSCTFCRREFRSAQALGGHMNVHRRDRALLKQSSIETNSSSQNRALAIHPAASCTFLYQNPNPDFHNSLITGAIRVASPPKDDGSSLCFLSSKDMNLVPSPSWSSFVAKKRDRPVSISSCRKEHKAVPVARAEETDLFMGLDLVVYRKEKVNKTDHDDDDDESGNSCKRQRIEAKPSGLSPKLGGDSCILCLPQTDVLKLSSSTPGEALDLELRLGDAPKVKQA